jgi:hypothetical protein
MAEAARPDSRLLDMLPNGERIELISWMECYAVVRSEYERLLSPSS